jgi:DGQHR domain-containing protein
MSYAKFEIVFDPDRCVTMYKAGSRVVDIAVAMGYERGHGQNRVRNVLLKAGIYKQQVVSEHLAQGSEIHRNENTYSQGLPTGVPSRDIQLIQARGTQVAKLKLPAARIRQGALTLYATSMKVKDMLADGFYNVETLDPENGDGYQRLLNKARARKFADYIVRGQDTQDAFLPTSVFLATSKSIDFDPTDNTIEIDTSAVTPFSVVDGQHRLEGLRMAAEKDERVNDFEIPVNFAIKLSKIEQMCHFLIVNTTQKSVDKSVEQRIYARLSSALDVEDFPSLPTWVSKIVEKGEIEKALKYVDYLNKADDSPWFEKIQMACVDSDKADKTTITQRTFVTAIVKYVLTANNPLPTFKDLEKEKKIFLNYWKGIRNILDDGSSSVLYKYNGVELFCKFSIPFFMKLQNKNSFTVATMEELLRSCLDNMEGEYAGVGHPEWWARGSQASRLNAAAINVVAQEMSKALHKTSLVGATVEI